MKIFKKLKRPKAFRNIAFFWTIFCIFASIFAGIKPDKYEEPFYYYILACPIMIAITYGIFQFYGSIFQNAKIAKKQRITRELAEQLEAERIIKENGLYIDNNANIHVINDAEKENK